MKYYTFCVLVCSLLLLPLYSGCRPNSNFSEEIVIEGTYESEQLDTLIKAVKNYFNFEKHKEWEKTYQYRTFAYKRTVSVDYYIKKMEKDNEGWKILKFNIISIDIKNDKATVNVHFIEETPRRNPNQKRKNTISITEETLWIQHEDAWLVLEPGTRTHVSLNSQIVLE